LAALRTVPTPMMACGTAGAMASMAANATGVRAA